MKSCSAMVAVVVAMGGLAAAAQAEPFDSRVVPADARWVLHVDLDAFRGSVVGDALLEQLEARKEGRHLEKVSEVLGFDVSQNLRGATLYGEAFTREATAILIRVAGGTGNIEGLMLAAPEYESTREGDRLIHSFMAEDKKHGPARMWVTLEKMGPDTLVLGAHDPGVLKAALAEATSGDGGQAGKAAKPGAGSIVYARLSGLEAAEFGPNVEHSGVLRLMRELTLDLGEANGRVKASARAEVVDEQRADQLRQLVQGVLAMAQLGGENDPKATYLAELAARTQVTREGSTVNLSLDADAKEVVDDARTFTGSN